MKRNTAVFFDQYSASFKAIYGSDKSVFRMIIDKLFRQSILLRFLRTLEVCQPIQGKTVLDVGCGPGYYSTALAKLGAGTVLGIDFAPNMVELARKLAVEEQVESICRFEQADFYALPDDKRFDYLILMGFMDYIQEPQAIIRKVQALTNIRAVFSFPVKKGFLAWQRKLRYKWKCPLYLYSEEQVRDLFRGLAGWTISIRMLSRDYFVVMEKANENLDVSLRH